MKPKVILKSLQSTFDLLQEDLEEAKKNSDKDIFEIYLKALSNFKVVKMLIESTIREQK